ncbi:MAG: hypothetical protein IPH62_16350 [Ignavibacteriae bacterium]|nr:hypothetical protein [Ignavibacteriota bacterium]
MLDINKKEFGKRLKLFLKTRFGTIESGADALGTTGKNISSNYINGRSLPGTEFLSKLYFWGCDIEWLISGKENRFFQKTGKIYQRVNNEIEKLKKLNFYYEFADEEKIGDYWLKSTILHLLNTWSLTNNLTPEDLVILSKIANVKIEYLLGYDTDPQREKIIEEFNEKRLAEILKNKLKEISS